MMFFSASARLGLDAAVRSAAVVPREGNDVASARDVAPSRHSFCLSIISLCYCPRCVWVDLNVPRFVSVSNSIHF